jgi:PAS domain S-box-containing protein
MKLILLVSPAAETAERVRQLCPPEYSLIEAPDAAEAIGFLRTTVVDLVLLDLGSLGRQVGPLLADIGSTQGRSTVVGVSWAQRPPVIEPETRAALYEWVELPGLADEVQHKLARALERQELIHQAAFLQSPPPAAVAAAPASAEEAPAAPSLYPMLREISKALAASFDQAKLLDLFLDLVVDMVRTSRASLMLADSRDRRYRIAAQRGLSHELAQGLSLDPSRGLSRWLAAHARILTRAEVERVLQSRLADSGAAVEFLEIRRELDALQATVALPLIRQGKTIGILNLGSRITGQPYHDDELDTLFTVANHLAVACHDIQLYHQMDRQKNYIETILTHMTSGVITIDPDSQVTIFNERAGAILGRPVAQIEGRDLRALPSPLGDMLYETMKTGAASTDEEVQLFGGRLPLEVSTYRLQGGDGTVLGAVMIFDDISARKELDAEKRSAQHLEIVNRLIGRMAHEVRNPLVAIKTFTELLPDKFDDADFRHVFCDTVTQEVKRLENVLDKLSSLLDPGDYQWEAIDVATLYGECVLEAARQERVLMVSRADLPKQDAARRVRADRRQLLKAFRYLLRNAVRSMPEEKAVVTAQIVRSGRAASCLRISITEAGSRLTPEDLGNVFVPFFSTTAGDVDLGLPVSQRIIEDHQGTIKVQPSPQGAGTVYEVLLPTTDSLSSEKETADVRQGSSADS